MALDDATVVNPHQVTLEVGDEVYAFEKFIPDLKTGETWYRGYACVDLVVMQHFRTRFSWSAPVL